MKISLNKAFVAATAFWGAASVFSLGSAQIDRYTAEKEYGATPEQSWRLAAREFRENSDGWAGSSSKTIDHLAQKNQKSYQDAVKKIEPIEAQSKVGLGVSTLLTLGILFSRFRKEKQHNQNNPPPEPVA